MNFGKNNRLVLLGAALALVLVVFSWLNTGQDEVKAGLAAEMSVAAQRVASLNLGDLKTRLQELQLTAQQAGDNLTAARAALSGWTEGIDASRTLYQIAVDSRVHLYIIESGGLTDAQFEGTPTSGLPLALRVQGEVTDILHFINRLHQAYPLAELSSVLLDNPDGDIKAATAADYDHGEITNAATASIILTLHNYPESDPDAE